MKEKNNKGNLIITLWIVFGVIIIVGFFVFSMIREVGAYMVAIPTVILGILFLLFPIPADVMIQKLKLKKAIKITRIIAGVVLVLGIAATIFAIFTI